MPSARISVPLASIDRARLGAPGQRHGAQGIGNGKGPPIRIQETAPDKVPMTSDPNVPTRRVAVATSRIEVAFPTYRPEDFPELVEREPEEVAELPAWQFDRLIERTQFATDPDSTRYALGGCAFEFEGPDPRCH